MFCRVILVLLLLSKVGARASPEYMALALMLLCLAGYTLCSSAHS